MNQARLSSFFLNPLTQCTQLRPVVITHFKRELMFEIWMFNRIQHKCNRNYCWSKTKHKLKRKPKWTLCQSEKHWKHVRFLACNQHMWQMFQFCPLISLTYQTFQGDWLSQIIDSMTVLNMLKGLRHKLSPFYIS